MQSGTLSTDSSATLESEAGAAAGVLSHALHVLGELSQLRLQAELCDVFLVGSDGQKVAAHKAVLAASTPYFKAMFTNGMKESTQPAIHFPGITSEILECLVNYMYSGHTAVTERNVGMLLEPASMWQLTSVLDSCCKFLLKNLDSDCCLAWATMGSLLSLPALYDGAMAFAERNFTAITKCENFYSLSSEILGDLLTRDGLFVNSETEVFDACIKWLKFEWPRHAAEASEVLRWVRWPHVPAATLACLDCDEELQFLRELPECATLLQYAKWGEWHVTGQRHKSWKRLRHSLACHGVVFAIGGETNPGRHIIREVEKFDSTTGAWESICPLPKPRRGAGAVIVDNMVYVAGGSDGLNALADIIRYDPETNRWSEIGQMMNRRSSVGAMTIGHVIYFIGGYDGLNSCHCSVETYNVQTRQQKTVASMTSARSMCSVAMMRDHIYAIGGYDGSDDLRTVECYDSTDDVWTSVASMSYKRYGLICNHLFLIDANFTQAQLSLKKKPSAIKISAFSSFRSLFMPMVKYRKTCISISQSKKSGLWRSYKLCRLFGLRNVLRPT